MRSASCGWLCGLWSLLWLCCVTLLPGQETQRKEPVPDQAKRAKALALIKDIFQEDLAGARTAGAKVKLANLLWEQAKDNNNDAAHRFVLLEQARDLAAAAGDARLAWQLVDELAVEFDVNALDLKAKVLLLAGASVESAEAHKDFLDLALPFMSEMTEGDQYDLALQLGKLAETAAGKIGSTPLIEAVKNRNNEIRAAQKSFARLQPFVARLKENPKDAEANLELGKYYCFFKGNWDRALPLLALGQDEALKTQAKKDLANPKDAHAQLAVADGWWELAGGEKGPVRLPLLKRARHWYDQAVVNLAGLNRTKALRRADRIQAQLAATIFESPIGPVGELKKFEGHQGEVRSVAFSPDGRRAASGSADQTVRLWDLITGKEERVFHGHANKVYGVAFHPAQHYLVSASWDGTVRFWDIKSGTESKRLTHPKDLNAVLVSRDGNSILAACDNKTAYLWQASTEKQIRQFGGHGDYVLSLAISPNGRFVATGSRDRSIRIHDLATGQLLRAIEGLPNEVPSLAFSLDSRYLFSCGDDFAHLWDVNTGKEVRRFEGHAGRVTSVALSPDGRRLLTGSEDKTLRLWEVVTGKPLGRFEGHTDHVLSVAFSPDGRRALSGSLDRTVRLWGLPTR